MEKLMSQGHKKSRRLNDVSVHCCANCSTVSTSPSDLIPLDSAQSRALVQLFQIRKSEGYYPYCPSIGITGSTTYLCISCFHQVQDVFRSIHKLTASWVKYEDNTQRGFSIFQILHERNLDLEICWSKLEPEEDQPTNLNLTASSVERKPFACEEYDVYEEDSLEPDLADHESPNSSERIAPIGHQLPLPTPSSPAPRTRNNKKLPKDFILVPNISTVPSSQSSCFICRTKKGSCRFSVTTKNRLKIWKSKQIFIPPTNRNCKTHLDPETGEILDAELELVEVSKIKKTIKISRDDQLISLVYNPKVWVNELIQEALERDCIVVLGLRCDEPSQDHEVSAPTPTKLQRRQLRSRRVIQTQKTAIDSEEVDYSEDDKCFEDNQADGNTLNCPIEDCSFSTGKRRRITKHLNQIHEIPIDQIHSCTVCCKLFPDKNQYKEHYNSHAGEPGVITCMEEGCENERRAFLSNEMLKYHRIRVHGQVELAPALLPSNCPKCNKTLSSHACLIKHIAAVHPEKLLEKNIICVMCGRKFATKEKLRDHKRYAHIPESAKFSCPHPGCLHKARTKALLGQHLVKHSEARNLQCHMCPRRYKERKSLQQHLLSHENQRKWVCNTFGTKGETCGRRSRFNRKVHLVQHIMKIHGLSRRESLEITNRQSSRADKSNIVTVSS